MSKCKILLFSTLIVKISVHKKGFLEKATFLMSIRSENMQSEAHSVPFEDIRKLVTFEIEM